MPRDGSGIYSRPPGTDGIPNTTISSAKYNSNVADVEHDLNVPRPIVAGGTGATNPADALTALGGVSATSGGTITGPLILRGVAPQLSLDATGAATNMISGLRGGLNRWLLQLGNNVAETGSNTGSELNLYGYNDDGTTGWGVLNVNRNTKVASQFLPTKFVDTTQAGSATTASVTLAGGLGVAKDVYFGGALNVAGAAIVNGNITTNANLLVNTGIFLGGTQFVSHDANYNYLCGPGGVTRLALGTSAIGLNTHYQTKHEFRDNTTAVQCTIDNTGVNVPTNVTTPLVRAGSSALAAVGTAINVGYLGGGSFGVTCRPGTDSSFPVVFYNAAGSQCGTIFTTATTTAYNTSSDYRLKQDFRTFDAGPIIDAINVYDFAWKDSGGRAHGVVAQEVELVYPEAVTRPVTEDMHWGVDYSRFVALLLQEVKMLRVRVAQLETQPAPAPR